MSRICLLCAVVVLSACGPSQVGFSTAPVSVAVDDCSSAIIVQLQDDGAKGLKTETEVTVALSVDSGLVSFHTDSTCAAAAVTSVTIAKDRETAVIFVKGLLPGAGTLTAAVEKLKSVPQAVTVTVPVYPLADLCRDLPGALCAYYVRCGRAQTEADCVDVLTNRQRVLESCLGDNAAAIKDARMTQDPIHARRCIASLRNTAACTRDDVTTFAECAETLTGAVGVAQTCYFDDECADTAYCSATSSSCPGQCTARQMASTVATRDRQCNAGLYVYNGFCVAPVSANGACGPVAPSIFRQRCVTGYICDMNNVCTTLRTVGQTCGQDEHCAGVMVCSNGICANAGSPGATCNIGILGQPSIPCKSDLYCDVTTIGIPGVCKVLEPTGGACFITGSCKPGNSCSGAVLVGTPAKGMCVAVKPVTSTCNSTDECAYQLYCDGAQRCVARKGQGTACVSSLGECNGNSRECSSDLCCQAGQCRPMACHDPTP